MSRSVIGYLVGFAIFLFVLSRVDVAAALGIIMKADPFYLVLAVVLVLPVILLEAFRWHFILGRIGIRQDFRESFVMFASSLYIGFVTPARVGEFVRVSFLRGHKLGRVFFSVFLDRISDVVFIFGVGYLGILFFAVDLRQLVFWISASFIAGIIVLAAAFLRRDLVKGFLRAVFHRIVPEKFKSDVKSAFYDFYSSFFSFLSFKPLSVVFFVTAISWLVYFFQVFLLAKALSIEISFVSLATMMSVASLLSILPISVSGIGTRDAAFVFFFGLLGIGSEFAVALSALVLLLMVVVALFCFPFWLRKPVDVSFFVNDKSR